MFAETIPSEGVDQLLYAMAELGASGYISYALEMGGRIDADVLAAAVRLAMDAEPILGCRFVADGNKPHWRRRTDLDSAVHCRVVAADAPLAAAETQALAPHDPVRDPVFRVFVFRQPKGADLLLLQIEHCVADGDGALRLIAGVAAMYTRLLADPHYRPAARAAYDWRFPLYRQLGWRGRLRLVGNALAELWAQARFMRHPSQGFRADPQRFWDAAAHSGAAYARLSLDKAELRPILLAASKHKAWLNDVLLTALLRAFADLAPVAEGAHWRALTFVNLRRFLPEHYAVPPCNLLSNHVLDLGTDLGERFQDTLAQVCRENRRLNDPTYVLRTQLLGGPMLRWTSLDSKRKLVRQAIARNCRNGAPLSLSNLGNIDQAGLRWGAVETDGFHVLGVPNPLPAVAVIGCGYRQGYTFTLAYYQSDLAREQVERFFGRVREELRIFAGTAV